MNTRCPGRLFLAAAVLIAGTLPHASLGSVAEAAIQRCLSADGTAIYTDRACSSLGAQPAPMSSELVRRIAGTGTHASYLAPPGPAPARRSPASGCARSAAQLASDLEGAFAIGDINRIAESYHWVGLSHLQGLHVMQRLERLSRQPLLQAHYIDAQIRSGWVQVADADAGSGGGMMQLVFGEGHASHAFDFDVQHYHGCYFVRFL